MKIKYILLAVLASTALTMPVSAQEKAKKQHTVGLYGHIHDSFTKAGIPETFITLMRPDSSVIDTGRVYRNPQPGASYDATYHFSIPRIEQDIIIRAEHPDYETTYVNYHVRPARNEFLDAPHHYMKKQKKTSSNSPVRGRTTADSNHSAQDSPSLTGRDGEGSDVNADSLLVAWEKKLDQVEITATKVRIAYRGDTVVFNADAFNVPEGSMLDGLIKQLPGVTLQSDGQIFVNGRKIENLTLNGKDFFRGQNKIMLDNLPYYTVKEVKVFDAMSEKSQMLGRNVEPTVYTMDVALKREYSVGTMANTTVGGGVEPGGNSGEMPYRLRLFGLRFTDNSRVTLFGQMNNLNEFGEAYNNGSWRIGGGNFRSAYKSVGGEWTFNDRGNNLTNTLAYGIMYSRTNGLQRTHNENYLSSGNTYGSSSWHGLERDFQYKIDNQFKLKFPFVMESRVEVRGANGNDDYDSQSNTTSDEAMQTLVNETRSQSRRHLRRFQADTRNWLHFKLWTGDELNIQLNGSYNHRKNENYAHNLYNYALSPADNSRRNEYTHAPTKGYDYSATATYELHLLNKWNLQAWYQYKQTYDEQTDYLHRLDLLNAYWADLDNRLLGSLPQTQDSLMAALDLANAYNQSTLQRAHEYGLRAYFNEYNDDHYIYVNLRLPMNTVGRTLHYNSSPLTTSLTRHNTYFSPSLYFQYYDRNWTRGAYLNMVINHVLPQMNQLIDRRNDANPLAVQTGNPSLRPSTSYRYDAMLRTGKRERDRALSLWWHTEVVRNAIGTGYTYDPTSGVRTYHPININGNWNGGAEFYIDTAIDSLKRWHFHSGTDYDFVRTKDLANVVGSDAQPFAAVQNHRLKQELRLQYNSGKLGLTWKGDAAWRRLLRDDGYDTGNSSLWEYNYGMELTYELPLGLNFNTTCYMHSRRGYQDETMNDDDLIWNAQLSRTFLKGKLTTTLLARDLLGQVSNTTYEVNAQGRTERWTNSLGRYLLLQFAYKFNTTPKK